MAATAATVVLAVIVAAACTTTPSGAPNGAPDGGGTGPGDPVRFVEVAGELGMDRPQALVRQPPACLFQELVELPESEWSANCEPERFSGAVALGDYDGDGLDDVFLTHLDGPDVLWRNQGDGTFVDVTDESGLGEWSTRSNAAAWADVDNDGNLDLVVTTLAEDRFYLFMNNGDGTFSEQAVERGVALPGDPARSGFGVTIGDYDNDGWIDLHLTEWRPLAHHQPGRTSFARLLRNRGPESPGVFEDVTERAGVVLGEGVVDIAGASAVATPVFSFASALVDLDGDGWADLVVASDFGTSQLFWNSGDGTFTDGSADLGLDATNRGVASNDMGLAVGDVNGDGLPDVFTTGIAYRSNACGARACPDLYGGNRLYLNNGDRSFTEVRDDAGVGDGGWGWGAAMLDVDNDGLTDLVMANGVDLTFGTSGDDAAGSYAGASDDLEVFASAPKRLWRNLGDGTFTEVAGPVGIGVTRPGTGVAVGDVFGDGAEAILMVHPGSTPTIWRNTGGRHDAWLQVQVRGSGGGGTNTDGIGAEVYVTARPGGPTVVRTVGANSHFLGQSSRVVHVGLGDAATLGGDTGRRTVAEVRVEFPASGRSVVLRDVPANERLVIREPAPAR